MNKPILRVLLAGFCAVAFPLAMLLCMGAVTVSPPGSGGGGGGSAPVGTVVNLVAPVQVGRPLVYSSLTGTNAIPGYTSLPEYSLTGNQTLTFTNDSQALIWNSVTNCTLTFDATTVTNGWEVVIKSLGAGSLILTNNSGLTFDGVSSLSLPVGVFGIGANGTNFRTLRISPNGVPAQNLFYASPDGASGVPRMRAIAVADVAASIVTSQQTNATLFSLGGVTTNAPAIATGSIAAFTSSNTIGAATSANLSSLTLTNSATGTNAVLVPDDVNTLAVRNGVNATSIRVYNTYTDASNYERGIFSWLDTANILTLGTKKAGTGSNRDIWIRASGTIGFSGAGLGTYGWTVNANNHLFAGTDNTYDIGATATSRPRSVYFGTGAQTPRLFGGTIKTLTSTTNSDFLYVAVANTNAIGGQVIYEVVSTDGTDTQSASGRVTFDAVGKSTAVTANITDVQNTPICSTGTLTAVLAKNVTTNNVFALGLTATTSLTTTNLVIKWRVEMPSATIVVNAL